MRKDGSLVFTLHPRGPFDDSMIRPFSLHITSEAEPANNLGRISIENFDAITNLERVLYYEEALAREDLRGRVGWERRRRQEERAAKSAATATARAARRLYGQ